MSLAWLAQGLTTTYDDHLLIIGDAAGHIDPLTGEGIHTAMMGGKAAAMTLLDMRRTGDFSKASTKVLLQTAVASCSDQRCCGAGATAPCIALPNWQQQLMITGCCRDAM